jgi:hypothetical protein
VRLRARQAIEKNASFTENFLAYAGTDLLLCFADELLGLVDRRPGVTLAELHCRIRRTNLLQIQDGVSRQVIANENWIEPTSGAGEL